MTTPFIELIAISFAVYAAIMTVLTLVNTWIDKISFITFSFVPQTSTFWMTMIVTCIGYGSPAILSTIAAVVLFNAITKDK